MPVNIKDPEYGKAEEDFHNASSPEEQIDALKRMISHAPKHKGSENLIAQLNSRKKKIEAQIEKKKKSGKSSKTGIRKEEMQAVITGKTNTGKSSLISLLTNQKPEIADYDFTTKEPVVGILEYQGTNIQIIENPALNSDFYDKSISYNTDTVIILVNSIQELNEIIKSIETPAKKIICLNKIDLSDEKEKRKIKETLKSKYKNYDFKLISCKTKQGIEELKNSIFKTFDKIRVYTKEPGQEIDMKKDKPMILEENSTIKDVAEKIFKGFSKQVKEVIITGPSSKFPNQKVGLKHRVKDLDMVEFKTR